MQTQIYQMNTESKSVATNRIHASLWGSLIGDALGVPVEFTTREQRRADPVTDLREYGTHQQPRGAWSDDGALLLCSVDSLVRHEFDLEDMGQRFVRWESEALWTPHGCVFDIGSTTIRAISALTQGVPAEEAGPRDEHSNGNGSLMRILPVSLRFASRPPAELLHRVHRASAVTHGHARSRMACGFHALVTARLLAGATVAVAVQDAAESFRQHYGPASNATEWATEWPEFAMLLDGRLAKRNEDEIKSGGHCMDTLIASLWCLLTTSNFRDCVLKAVNLGGDTDTTGCVAGGLAGLSYGIEGIPRAWREALPRGQELECLFSNFSAGTINVVMP